MDFEDRNNLYKIRKTVLEMLNDRGYIIDNNLEVSFEEFTSMYNNNNINIFLNDEKLGKAYINFHNEPKSITKSDLKVLLTNLIKEYEDDQLKLIIILKEKGNGSILKELNKEIYKNVEIFMNKNMMFNITHHEYVPKHIILNKEEEDILLDKYNTTKNKLPKILKSDPVVKYYGMKHDQICKIIRKSPEVGESIYYRIVK